MRHFIAPILALAVTAGTLTAVAQTKSKSAEKPTAEEKETSKYHRLPANYGKLELKDEQKTEIYGIKDKFGPKIDELKAELAALQDEMDAEIADVLTTTQKSALAKLKSEPSKTKPVSGSRTKSDDSSESEKTPAKRSSSKATDSKE